MTLYLLICAFPFLFAIGGIMVFAREIVGPLITLLAWLAMIIAIIVRNTRAVPRGESYISWFELVPILGILVVLQLLLDMHTPFLGDIVVASLHVLYALAALVSRQFRQ